MLITLFLKCFMWTILSPTIVSLLNAYFPKEIATDAYYQAVATSVEQYRDIAVRLGTQQEDYQQASQLNLLLIKELFANQQRCAQVFCKHFLAISQSSTSNVNNTQ